MTYLSRYALTPNESLRLRITDPYSLHRVVLGLFPEIKTGRTLFADKGVKRGIRSLLILSEIQPILAGPGELSTRIIPESFLNHSEYRFQIIVNPVVRKHATKKIEPVRNRNDIAAWFTTKSPNWGFACPEPIVDEIWVEKFRHKDADITLGCARISGVLQVTDRERFIECFKTGLGRGRAFGCGLLQLKPLSTR